MQRRAIVVMLTGLVVAIGVATYANYSGTTRKARDASVADTTGAGRGAPADTLNEADAIVIVLDSTTYKAGDGAELTIENHSDSLVMFSLVCDAFIEGKSGEGWITVFEPDCSRVRVRPTRLDGGESVKLKFFIPATLTRYEKYRVRLRVQKEDGADLVVHSYPFSIKS